MLETIGTETFTVKVADLRARLHSLFAELDAEDGLTPGGEQAYAEADRALGRLIAAESDWVATQK